MTCICGVIQAWWIDENLCFLNLLPFVLATFALDNFYKPAFLLKPWDNSKLAFRHYDRRGNQKHTGRCEKGLDDAFDICRSVGLQVSDSKLSNTSRQQISGRKRSLVYKKGKKVFIKGVFPYLSLHVFLWHDDFWSI